MNVEKCDHTWGPTDVDKNGNPGFRLNRQISPDPMAHFHCKKCGGRTWLNKAVWDAIVEGEE